MAEFGPTPSQTVGPFFAYGLTPAAYGLAELAGNDLVTADAVGERIEIVGRVLDGEGVGVPDAFLEIWQADGEGRFAGFHPALANAAFKGFGRAQTDKDGAFSLRTVKPGPVPGAGGAAQAPHLSVTVFARGLLTHLRTRIYFADEPANNTDALLSRIPAVRRGTLIAGSERPGRYRFDVRLQGTDETVFFTFADG